MLSIKRITIPSGLRNILNTSTILKNYSVQVTADPSGKGAIFTDGEKTTKVHSLWLRERTTDPDLVLSDSNQRKFEVSELMTNGNHNKDKFKIDTRLKYGILEIEHASDKLKDQFNLDHLVKETLNPSVLPTKIPVENGKKVLKSVSLNLPTKQSWTGVDSNKNFDVKKVTHFYNEISNDEEKMYYFLNDLLTWGTAVVKGVPAPVRSYEKFLGSFGIIRETNWGKWFEVSVVQDAQLEKDGISSSDAAYTTIELPLHTDGPYNENPLCYQLLQCIKQSQTGGESLLSDGLAAAEILRTQNPESFKILCETQLGFRFYDDSNEMYEQRAMINVDCNGNIANIYFSGRLDIVPHMETFEEMERFYQAKQDFIKLLYKEENLAEFKLDADDMLIFDNRRVLHGRKAFTDTKPENKEMKASVNQEEDVMVDHINLSTVSRYLRGCYLENVNNKFRTLSRKMQQKNGTI